jgi:hypothetical protein
MGNNRTGRRTTTSQAWPVTLLGAFGLWLWLAHGGGMAMLLGAAALVLPATLGVVWLSRARAARRLNAVLHAYAEREIDRERRRHGPPGVRGVSPPGGALPGGATRGR